MADLDSPFVACGDAREEGASAEQPQAAAATEVAAPSWDTPRAAGAEAAGGKGSGAEAEVLRCMVGEKGQLRSVWHLPDGCAALQV